jgi:NAD(P)-dependent dehydrogenase (short-subunit alcohol dehydrogenase family)
MKDKVIVITGASQGIGLALAERCVAAGAKVVLAARNAEALDAVARRLGPAALAVSTDVTSKAALEALRDRAIAHFGHIDVWVNNAGRGINKLPSELTDADLDDMFLVNVKSVHWATQAVLPHFKARGQGQLVNVSSLLGRVPMAPLRSAYSAAKHAMNALTAMLRAELEEAFPGIIVTLVSPGVVATGFGNNALHGGPDSRAIPNAQPVGEVADVMAAAITTPLNGDVYTRPAYKQMIVDYYSGL